MDTLQRGPGAQPLVGDMLGQSGSLHGAEPQKQNSLITTLPQFFCKYFRLVNFDPSGHQSTGKGEGRPVCLP